MPILRFESMLGSCRLGTEQSVVPIEAIKHGRGHVKGHCRPKFLWKFCAGTHGDVTPVKLVAKPTSSKHFAQPPDARLPDRHPG